MSFVVDEQGERNNRALMTENRFDPKDVHKENWYGWTPLIRFCCLGDLDMCRYLAFRGADCRKTDSSEYAWFPMYAAAANGHGEICNWLYHDGGAKDDIRKQVPSGYSPLRVAFELGYMDVVQWVIMKEALAPRNDVAAGGIDVALMRNDLRQKRSAYWRGDADNRLIVLDRAHDAVTTHDNLKSFLKGTITTSASIRRRPNNEYATRSRLSPLVLLKGKSDILKVIANYAGMLKAKDVRTLRQLLVLLPVFIENEPFKNNYDSDDYENENNDDDDY